MIVRYTRMSNDAGREMKFLTMGLILILIVVTVKALSGGINKGYRFAGHCC